MESTIQWVESQKKKGEDVDEGEVTFKVKLTGKVKGLKYETSMRGNGHHT